MSDVLGKPGSIGGRTTALLNRLSGVAFFARLGGLSRTLHTVTLMGTAADLCLALVGSALVSRLLLAEGRGQVGRWIYWGALVANLISSGINTALPQMVGATQLDHRSARRAGAALCLVIAPLATMTAWAISPLVQGPTGSAPISGWRWIAFAFVPATTVLSIGQGLLIAQGKIRFLMVTKIANRVLFIIVITTLLAWGIRTSNVTAAVTAMTTVSVAGVTLVGSKMSPFPWIGRELWSKTLRRGLNNHVPTLVVTALSFVDHGWIFTHLSDNDAGNYLVAVSAASTIELVGIAEITASTVAMSDPLNGWRHARTALLRTAVLLIIALAAGYMLAPVLIPLWYGEAFRSAVSVFRILLVSLACNNVGRVGEAVLQTQGRRRTAWVFQIVRGATLIGLMAWFGRSGGLRNATVAMASSSAIAGLATLLTVAIFMRGSRESRRGVSIPKCAQS